MVRDIDIVFSHVCCGAVGLPLLREMASPAPIPLLQRRRAITPDSGYDLRPRSDRLSHGNSINGEARGRPMGSLQVWTEFKVIKETSALTFMVAGTCKEIVTGIPSSQSIAISHDCISTALQFWQLLPSSTKRLGQ